VAYVGAVNHVFVSLVKTQNRQLNLQIMFIQIIEIVTSTPQLSRAAKRRQLE
jgi:hypothetical protein